GLKQITFALGHVGLCRALLDTSQLDEQRQNEYFDLLQIKDVTTIGNWMQALGLSRQTRQWLIELPQLCGDISVLEQARRIFEGAPAAVKIAIDEIEAIYRVIRQRFPDLDIYLDLGEFRGYYYHTGVVFAAYAPGESHAIASGGRYDHIGEAYGRARPATGFGISLTSIVSLMNSSQTISGIYAPPSRDPKQWQAIKKLRDQGKRVVCGLSESSPDFAELRCDRQLLLINGDYRVESLK
ncbi:MAG: ATP phosphoribosyltransferase regulatory subunit, partial [Cellvibrionaceae bacterium]